MNKGNFKIKCVNTISPEFFTKGKIYQVKDGVLTWNNGDTTENLNTFEDIQYSFASKFELVREYSDEYISIKRRRNRVVAVMSVDGQYKKSANVKLKDYNNEFGKAAKAVIEKLIEKKEGNEQTPLTADGFKVGDKVKLKKGLVIGNKYGGITLLPSMKHYDVMTVKQISNKGNYYTDKGKYYSSEMLELVTETSSIDWGAFTRGEFAVHCDTEEKAKAFLKECDEQGIKWFSGDKSTSYTNFPQNKTYGILYFGNDNKLTYSIYPELHEDDTIIDYIPSKPTVKESEPKPYLIVKQDKYEVGDTVKIRNDLVNGIYGDNSYLEHGMGNLRGKIATISMVTHDGTQYRFDETDWYDWTPEMFEGKVVKDVPEKPAVKEVKRHAQPGEFIKIVNAYGTNEKYQNGDILQVKYRHTSDAVTVTDFEFPGICDDEYVVLEGYVPEDKPEVRVVKRPANVGEWIKKLRNGKIEIVVALSKNIPGCVYTKTDKKTIYKGDCADRQVTGFVDYLSPVEYVVLENYQPEEPKPFRKAMVGDKIKVIKTAGKHMPNLRLGDVHTVKEVNGGGAWTDKGNFFYDSNQEYIVVEEAPEEIKVGDTVKVVNTGNSYTTYSDWFKENEPDIGLRYAFGQTVPEGTGYKVIAKHPHNKHNNKRSKDILYAISKGSSYSSVYLVGERAIEKVK